MVKLLVEYNSSEIPIDHNLNCSIKELKDLIALIFEIEKCNFNMYLSGYGVIDFDETIDLPLLTLSLGIILFYSR